MGDLSLNLSELDDSLKNGPVKIAVQVPRTHDPSVVSEDKRFLTGLSTSETDETSANNSIIVDRKFLNVKLRVSNPGSAKYSELPIAEFHSDGAVVHFTNYHPPAFRLLESFSLKT